MNCPNTLFDQAEIPPTNVTLAAVQEAGEDFEWYPTTQRMIEAVKRWIPTDAKSIMDIGAGDGRVLIELAKKAEHEPDLYAIEKSVVLVQAQPENITPVGTDLFEQNLACLPVDYIFCNPPYSEFEAWASTIIESGYAKLAFLVIPQRWKDSEGIAASLKRRGATAKVIHSDDFLNAERRARAVVDIVEISYPRDQYAYGRPPQDPFDIWFDQNIDTFDREKEISEDEENRKELARLNGMKSIAEMVDAYNEEYGRMEENYRAIFKLDYAILKELGVDKKHVREGIKKKMTGLKAKYWELLFTRLDTITNRLATATKDRFLKKIQGRTSVAFTANNAYAVVLWAIKHANKYYDEQLVKLFRDLSTHDGVMNYKSNQRTWQKDGWRYRAEDHSHYALDYRIVLDHYYGIQQGDTSYERYEYPGRLHRSAHEVIDDAIAVLYTLGFTTESARSRIRQWTGGQWQDFHTPDGDILFQVKAYKNGNLHWRFMPDAIRRLNVEAGRLLGWLRSPSDVVEQLGYSAKEAAACFGSSFRIAPSNLKLLSA